MGRHTDLECTVDVPVGRGTLVLFSKVLPHRVERVTCSDASNGVNERRTFVTAFMAEPLHSIQSTSQQDDDVTPMHASHEDALTVSV